MSKGKALHRRALTWGIVSSFNFLFVVLFFPKIEAVSPQRATQKTYEKNLVEPLVDSPAKTIGSDFNGDGIHDILTSAEWRRRRCNDFGKSGARLFWPASDQPTLRTLNLLTKG
jgi:hypothetical protein